MTEMMQCPMCGEICTPVACQDKGNKFFEWECPDCGNVLSSKEEIEKELQQCKRYYEPQKHE